MIRRKSSASLCLTIIVLLSATSPDHIHNQAAGQAAAFQTELEEAVEWVRSGSGVSTQYDYMLTAGVRLLFFWVSRDDVGQGYIRRGTSTPETPRESIQLLIGSDPAKAPMRINRWGAATEVRRPEDGICAFFGFMKSSKGESASAMREDLSREDKAQNHRFDGIIARTSRERSIAATVPIGSAVDFNLHQLSLAEEMVIRQLKTAAGPVRILNGDGSAAQKCDSGNGFLFTVHDMIEELLSGQEAPLTHCYVYNSRRYALTLKRCTKVPDMKITVKPRGAKEKMEIRHQDLRNAEFVILNTQTGERTDFRLVLGVSGRLRGVPVQIHYQPNWWFRATLNLMPERRQ